METKKELVITRTYNAPRVLVYKAWTVADALAEWWGPKGSTIIIKKLDFRSGGIFHYGMAFPNGAVMWGIFAYREILEPAYISFINSFSDEEGNAIRSPYHQAWPLEILTEVTLEEHDGKTTLTVKARPINATDEEMDMYAANIPQMGGGFKGTFDKLEEYLAKS